MKFQIIKREDDKTDWNQRFTDEINRRFEKHRKKNPKGYMDSFEESINTHMAEAADKLGLPFQFMEGLFTMDATGQNLFND